MNKKTMNLIAIFLIGLTTIASLNSFSEADEKSGYLSFSAGIYNNSFEIHTINENGEMDVEEISGSPSKKNNLQFKKYIWKKMNELRKRGYVLSHGRDNFGAGGVPNCSYIFEKE